MAGIPVPRIRLKFEVARQARSPSPCGSESAVPWADEAKQQLSRLAPAGCKLSADVLIFGAGVQEDSGRYTRSQDRFEV